MTQLYPPGSGPNTLYCPFSATHYCNPSQDHCCETPSSSPPSACTPLATACMTGTGYTDWHCEDPVDCTDASKPVCCAPGASIGLGGPGCGNFAYSMTSTTCVAAGSCNGIIMCTSTLECPAGKTCTPFDKAGNYVGGCL